MDVFVEYFERCMDSNDVWRDSGRGIENISYDDPSDLLGYLNWCEEIMEIGC